MLNVYIKKFDVEIVEIIDGFYKKSSIITLKEELFDDLGVLKNEVFESVIVELLDIYNLSKEDINLIFIYGFFKTQKLPLNINENLKRQIFQNLKNIKEVKSIMRQDFPIYNYTYYNKSDYKYVDCFLKKNKAIINNVERKFKISFKATCSKLQLFEESNLEKLYVLVFEKNICFIVVYDNLLKYYKELQYDKVEVCKELIEEFIENYKIYNEVNNLYTQIYFDSVNELKLDLKNISLFTLNSMFEKESKNKLFKRKRKVLNISKLSLKKLLHYNYYKLLPVLFLCFIVFLGVNYSKTYYFKLVTESYKVENQRLINVKNELIENHITTITSYDNYYLAASTFSPSGFDTELFDFLKEFSKEKNVLITSLSFVDNVYTIEFQTPYLTDYFDFFDELYYRFHILSKTYDEKSFNYKVEFKKE